MKKLYSRINWENFPSERTALNESNLNRMDLAIDNIDNRVIEMDSTKVNKEVANNLVKTWSIDEETGIITVEHLDGSKDLFDLNIEKIPVNFELSDNGILTMTTDDGTQYTANIGAMIPVLTFEDSDEIAVSVTGTGVNKTYLFSIKAGSVTEDKLQPNFLADVKTEVAKAQASQSAAAESASAASGSATLAESYTHGGTGTREGEDADNARYYMEQAKAVSAVNVATTETAGIVKPDGDTITVDHDGTIHGQSKVDEMTGATADANGTSGTVPAPTAGQENHVLKGNGAWEAITYDSELSAESENAPQTKVVEAKTKEIETNLSQLSNPNLLINPDFRINQRGGKISLKGIYRYEDSGLTTGQLELDKAYKIHTLTSTYGAFTGDDGLTYYVSASDVVDGYCENTGSASPFGVDRWQLIGCNLIVFQNRINVTNTIESFNGWIQTKIELLKKSYQDSIFTYTVSTSRGLISAIGKIGTLNLENDIIINSNWENEDVVRLYIQNNNNTLGNGFDIYWAKLELGSIATPFVPPDPASELLKCMRYYAKNEWCVLNAKNIGNSFAETIMYKFNVPMRVPPTIRSILSDSIFAIATPEKFFDTDYINSFTPTDIAILNTRMCCFRYASPNIGNENYIFYIKDNAWEFDAEIY